MKPSAAAVRETRKKCVGEDEGRGEAGAGAPDQPVHGDQPRKAGGKEHDHGDEHNAEIEHPRLGYVGQRALEEVEQHGAEDRPGEIGHAADIDHEQHQPRLDDAHLFEADMFDIDGVQRAGNAGEEGRQRKGEPPYALARIADELDAFGVVRARRWTGARRGCG